MSKISSVFNKIVMKNKIVKRPRLILIYILCVLCPLLLTDAIFFSIFMKNENARIKIEMENEAESFQGVLDRVFDEAADVTRKVYVNEDVNKFLEASYPTAYDFYERRYEIKKDFFNFFTSGSDSTTTNIEIYANNPTIVNGGFVKRLSAAEDKVWYQEYRTAGRTAFISCYYIGGEELVSNRKKRISMLRNMDYFRTSIRQKFVKVDIDYSPLVRRISDMKYPYEVYLCIGDKIILTSDGHSDLNSDFDYLTGDEKFGVERKWNIYGQEFRILIKEPDDQVVGDISDYSGLGLAVVLLNIALPFILISFINQSFENRIGRQQSDIARQNAELLAMQSQINPHFLFNVLESVRMHSILKSENETADMIERLSVLVRQNVNWKEDNIPIEDEVKFIEDYLQLQKYRFGDKLSYMVELEENCKSIRIPRLTLVTFVENSCVHGMEKKTSTTWIYVRIYCKNDILVMEIEDTGDGMPESEVERLNESMNNALMDDLKKNSHIGVINACIRLKMKTDNKATFELESEEGVGTFTVIKVPLSSITGSLEGDSNES